MAQEDIFKKIISHCKEYGFVFPSSDIYDGLAAVYDYGQNGVELKNNSENQEELINNESHSDYTPASRFDASAVHHLSGMYQGWFLAYASYVILERAVPHIEDGLKPVQRRILHSMKRMDDGRYNKVANIVGHTMQFHPHGDASIGDALVQMGQKNLLIDMQGNWGNILTGDRAAAPRYIEARLSQFALDVVFNPKTTNWQLSYDGRNQEPITLPAKFPLLLAQGAEGIAVGLSSKILPHNPNEPSLNSAECRARWHEFSRSQITETDRNITRLPRFFAQQNCHDKNVPVRLKYEEKKKNPLVQSHIAHHITPALAVEIE